MFRKRKKKPRLPQKSNLSPTKGVTLTEMMMAVAISAIVVLIVGKVFTTTTTFATKTDLRIRADVNLRAAMDKVETLLLNSNNFLVATTTEVIFVADLTTDPDYAPAADFDADGFLNLQDPDDDDDATLITAPTAQWAIGYDLRDDDDDNDNNVDMLWRIYLATQSGTANNALSYDYSKNGEAWGGHVTALVSNVVSTGVFTFFGSENDYLSPGATTYDLNGDSIITASEMDAASNGGNGNGRLDNATERGRIITVEISIAKDENRDGTTESFLTTEVMPPALYLKRRP